MNDGGKCCKGSMSKITILLSLALFVTGCQVQAAATLPTLAVLPSVTPALEVEPALRPLAFWQVVDGALLAADQVDQWRFAARANDPIALDTLGAVNLVLQAPDGSILGTGTEIKLVLPVDGDYTVSVQAVDGPVDRYQLELAYTDRPNPADVTATAPPVTIAVPTPTPPYSDLGLFIASLDNGEMFSETFLNGPVQPHIYTFEGRVGDYLTASMMRVAGALDPTLMLYGPDGVALAVDHNTGSDGAALLRNVVLPQDGLYSLQASGGNAPGNYQITLNSDTRPVPVTPTIIAPPTATASPQPITTALATAIPDLPLAPQIAVAGSLLRGGDVDRYPIVVSSGDVVTIGLRKLEPGSPWLPQLELYNPLGELVSSANFRNTNSAGDLLLPLLNITQDGTYSLFVTAERNTYGDYVLAYGQGANYQDVPHGPALADVPYDGSVAWRGLRDFWTVALNQGDIITVAASPTNNAFDPVIELMGPDGALVASDDNSGGYPNALMSDVTAPSTGLYRLYVSGSSGSSTGPYRLIWRYVNAAPTPTYEAPRILLFTIEDEVVQGEYQFYPFQGVAGQRVRIKVNGDLSGDFDPVAALIGPDGNVVAEADDVDGSLNPQFSVDLPASGTYQVRVNGYLSGGPFDLVVERLF